MKDRFDWSGIKWTEEQDIVLSKTVCLKDSNGEIVLKDGKPVHPTRERVRQKRLSVFMDVIKECLPFANKNDEVEEKAHKALVEALNKKGRERSDLFNFVHKELSEMDEGSEFRSKLIDAYDVYRPMVMYNRRDTLRDKILELPVSTMTIKEIAEDLDCSSHYVYHTLRENDLSYLDARKETKYDWDKIKSYQWSGPNQLTDKEIADILGIGNFRIVSNYRWRHNLKKRSSKVDWSKLSKIQLDCMTLNQLSNYVGCSTSAVSQYKSRMSKFLKKYEKLEDREGLTDQEVADKLGCRLETVEKYRKQLDCKVAA